MISLHFLKGPCKVVSVLDKGLFELSNEVNGKFIKYNRIYPQFLKGFKESLY